MSWKRYLVHLSVLCLLATAAAFANPLAEAVFEGVTYGDVWPVDRPSVGVVGVQQGAVQFDAEMRETKRAAREHRAENAVAAPDVEFDARWLDVEAEMRLFLEEHVRFLAALAAREAHAAGECLETN